MESTFMDSESFPNTLNPFVVKEEQLTNIKHNQLPVIVDDYENKSQAPNEHKTLRAQHSNKKLGYL
jgi:endo-alpha-1,4-polygalactosaminidase (GH114 family)